MKTTDQSAKLYSIRDEDLLLASAISNDDYARSTDFRPLLFSAEREPLARRLARLAFSFQALTRENLLADGAAEDELLAFDQASAIESPPHGKALLPVASVLKDMAARRHVMSAARLLYGEAPSLTAEEIAEKAAGLSVEAARIEDDESCEEMHDGSEMADVLADLQRRIERPGEMLGHGFNFLRLQQALDGLQPGRLVVVGGRPHQGKTTLMLNIIMGAMDNGMKPGVFSLEQTATQLKQAMLDIHSGVSFEPGQTPTKNDLIRIRASFEAMSKWKWRIADDDRMPIDRICAKARALKHRHGCDLIVIDYLQIVSASRFTDDMRMGLCEITGKLKALSKELNVCIIAASQLNRTQAKTDPNTGRPIYGRPSLSGLKESASIESDADAVLLIHRELENEEPGQTEVDMEIVIAKNRQTGRLGEIRCRFSKQTRRIVEAHY